MLIKIVKSTTVLALFISSLSAASFNAGAEKDRLEMIKFFEAKFEDPAKNKDRFFTYFTEEELEQKYDKNLKHMDFNIGSYAYSKDARSQYEALKEMPPYEDAIEKGEELYTKKFANGNSLQTCFPDLTNAGTYPYYDKNKKELISLTKAVNDCLRANGEKEWGTKKGPMAEFQAYWVNESKEAGKKFNIKINSKAEKEAYERGKEYYYSQRGYLKLSCATCHIQGSGQRVRNEVLSPLLGQVTHFPVLRLKWTDIGTVERRLSGCVVDQGQVPPKDESQTMIELIYFLAYMSNDMPVDGPDVRK
ncbi:sulfur oxidation c-type cytochrome SoxA [Aliarcobacter cryaerophilus]|uniref:sulfur oxidation c-type cytochrome SoxA n=1 Tax=Aliarcobacter cryaerophilus TaxID=28198 RepID=UPI0021B661A5|nr:sulfur oxidation c-type cytochrome SoxA [Aliarcobacter cryaerophilus]MCT7510376.1 sulfur oxidation c-type cytochrome SoxA [Aliarcobacter cryaerophilus]